jgi:hypothetical protein
MHNFGHEAMFLRLRRVRVMLKALVCPVAKAGDKAGGNAGVMPVSKPGNPRHGLADNSLNSPFHFKEIT